MIIMGACYHGALIARAARTGFDADVDKCIIRIVDGEFLGGFIITGFNGAICYVHMAGKDPRWCSPELMWTLFDYCFNELQVRRMLCTCDSVNQRSLRQIMRTGWQSDHRILGGTPSGDLLVFSMTRDRCPWLKLKPRFLKVNGGSGETAYAHA